MMHILEKLKEARELKGVDLDTLAERTRLRVHLLEAVETGRFDALPRGMYARAVVRAYAEAVGFDPNRVVTEVAAMLPEAEDPLDGMKRVRGFERPARREEPAQKQEAAAPPPQQDKANRPPADLGTSWMFALPDSNANLARAAAASAVDGGILGGIALVLAAFTSRVSGVPAASVLEVAGPAMFVVFLLIAALYFVLLGGIRGETVGARLLSLERTENLSRVTASAALRRAGAIVLREGSILVDVLVPSLHRAHADGTPAVARSRTP